MNAVATHLDDCFMSLRFWISSRYWPIVLRDEQPSETSLAAMYNFIAIRSN